MKEKKQVGMLAAGLLIGSLLTGPGARAATNAVEAVPSCQPIYVDGRQVNMAAYNIGGHNYVMLRDIGREVGFHVYWDGAVQIESCPGHTGKPPAKDAPTDVEALRQEMIGLINEVRRENGVPELKVDDRLMAAAQECSGWKMKDHRNREECEAVIAHGYPYGFGGNLTAFTNHYGPDTAKHAVDNWINSPGHFQTMIDPRCDTLGVGITMDDTWVYCHMFVGDPSSHNPYE